MATFSAGDALPVTALEVRADRRVAIAVFVFVSCSSSLARFAPVVADMYPIASMRSVLSWAMNAGDGITDGVLHRVGLGQGHHVPGRGADGEGVDPDQ